MLQIASPFEIDIFVRLQQEVRSNDGSMGPRRNEVRDTSEGGQIETTEGETSIRLRRASQLLHN